MIYTIVFVCTGNTCRSPMAQIMLHELLAENGGAFKVLSAGTHAATGAPAAGPAVGVMEELGLDLNSHSSTMLSPELVAEADLLLTMTEAHKNYVIDSYPHASAKTFTLKQFAGLDGDVGDPFGGDVGIYRETAVELRRLLQTVAQRLLSGEISQ